MKHPKLSFNERLLFLKELKNRQKIHEKILNRKKRLYNRKFRKSSFFIGTWILRLIYIALFILIVFSDYISNGFDQEVVTEMTSENYTINRGIGRRHHYSPKLKTKIDFTTDKSNYYTEFNYNSAPHIQIGDTLNIERDILQKPIYYSKNGWDYKYRIDSYFDETIFFINLIIFIFTLISFAFNDGLYKFNKQVFTFIFINITIGSSLYILNRLYYLILG